MIEKAQKVLDILLEGNKNFVNGKCNADNRNAESLIALKTDSLRSLVLLRVRIRE